MVTEQSVLVVDVLDAGEMGRREDLSGLDKLRNGKARGVLLFSSGEYLPTMVQGGTTHFN